MAMTLANAKADADAKGTTKAKRSESAEAEANADAEGTTKAELKQVKVRGTCRQTKSRHSCSRT